MEFWAAAECHFPVHAAITTIRRAVEPYLNSTLAASSLAAIDGKLRYVPIVMPLEMHAKYTERSKFNPRSRIYDCAPHLDYEIFLSRSFEEQLVEYLRGIAQATPHLAKLGASEQQIREFRQILRAAQEHIPIDRPDEFRH